jgi:hypothetical protein
MADTENGNLEYPCFLFVFSLFSNIFISNVYILDVFLCFQILFITKALFFKCFKHDFRPNFNVANIIFESYEHRSKIIPPLLTSFAFITVCFVPHRRTVDLTYLLNLGRGIASD